MTLVKGEFHVWGLLPEVSAKIFFSSLSPRVYDVFLEELLNCPMSKKLNLWIPTKLKIRWEPTSMLLTEYFYTHLFLHVPFKWMMSHYRGEGVLWSFATIARCRFRVSMSSTYTFYPNPVPSFVNNSEHLMVCKFFNWIFIRWFLFMHIFICMVGSYF